MNMIDISIIYYLLQYPPVWPWPCGDICLAAASPGRWRWRGSRSSVVLTQAPVSHVFFIKAFLKHKLTCSNQNKLYIIMDFLFCLRNIHFLIFQVNAAVCPSWQQNCTLLLLILYAMNRTSSYLITMKSLMLTVHYLEMGGGLVSCSIFNKHASASRRSSYLWEGKHSDNSW